MIETSCPRCGKAYLLKPELAGRKARCRNCSTTFLVPDEEIDDLEMVSVAIESFRPPARPEKRVSQPVPPAGIDFSTGHEADDDDDDSWDEDDDFDHDQEPRRPRSDYRPPAWKTGQKRRRQGLQIPLWAILGIPGSLAVAAVLFFFVVPWIKGPSVAELTGLDEAIAARFEMADDPPLGSPAPAGLRPVVGQPMRDLSAHRLILEDLITLFEEFHQQQRQVKDFITHVILEDWIEKSLRPRMLMLKSENDTLWSPTKKENSQLRDTYVRYIEVFDKVLAEFERFRQFPESEGIEIDEALLNQYRAFKSMAEKEFRAMEPNVDTRPEGDPKQYAELRVIGTDTPETKAMFEARLYARHTLKYINVRQNGSAPTRFAVWPVDDVAMFARGIDAGRVVHVTDREIWIIVEPLSASAAESERLKAVEFRKANGGTEAEKLLRRRAERNRNAQGDANALAATTTPTPEPPPAVAPDTPRSRGTRSQRAEEIRRSMTNGSSRAGIPENSGGAAAGLGPVNGSESRGTGVTVGSPDRATIAARGDRLTSKADANQVAKFAGQRDAFSIALERIRNVNDEDNAGVGMLILLKIDLKGRESEVIKAMGPYLDSPFENRAAVALLVLDRIDDPRRVDEVIKRLGLNRQTDPLFCAMLVTWKDKRAIEPLAKQLSGFPLWKHFDDALIAFGPAAEKAVIAQLAATEKETRKRACEILGAIGGEESLKIFAKLKPDSDPFVRMAANEAISKIRTRLGKPEGRRPGR